MGNDLSNFDNFENNFIPMLREAMDKLAFMGEQYVKSKNSGGGAWGVDTQSSLNSITGYEAKIGDPYANFNDPAWQHAQQVGSDRYPSNTPEHYQPHVENADIGENENPTAVLAIFTGYPDPDRDADQMLQAAVMEALDDAGQYMRNNMLGTIQDSMRWGMDSPISVVR